MYLTAAHSIFFIDESFKTWLLFVFYSASISQIPEHPYNSILIDIQLYQVLG